MQNISEIDFEAIIKYACNVQHKTWGWQADWISLVARMIGAGYQVRQDFVMCSDHQVAAKEIVEIMISAGILETRKVKKLYHINKNLIK